MAMRPLSTDGAILIWAIPFKILREGGGMEIFVFLGFPPATFYFLTDTPLNIFLHNPRPPNIPPPPCKSFFHASLKCFSALPEYFSEYPHRTVSDTPLDTFQTPQNIFRSLILTVYFM